MPDVNSLAGRIDAEFSTAAEKIRKFQIENLEEHRRRQKRLEQLSRIFEELRNIWGPRLELLVKKFGDGVKVAPKLMPSRREAAFEFQSKLAFVHLKFSAYTDWGVRRVILSYDLKILPGLMEFIPHAEMEFPLDAVDKEAVGNWIDDRIVEFVQTYLSLNDNEAYLKEHMVQDPVALVRFPTFAAGATLEWNGQKYYFLDEETRREFAELNEIALPHAAS
jgi:YHS domain-containing protein